VELGYDIELSRSRRFFETTFDDDVTPSEGSGIKAGLPVGQVITAGDWLIDWEFSHPKFITPTISTLNPHTGGTAAYAAQITGTYYANVVATTLIGKNSVAFKGTGGTTSELTGIHAYAEALL
jgi:hypothetical protein